MLNATVTAQSRLQTPEQFRQIIVKTHHRGATVRLSDVARIELGAEKLRRLQPHQRHTRRGHRGAAGTGRRRAEDRRTGEGRGRAQSPRSFPPGLKVAYANDTTAFIKLSIDEVVKTLLEAIVLVVIVMFVFLQSWRATLVPAIAVPVVLLGTFAIFHSPASRSTR